MIARPEHDTICIFPSPKPLFLRIQKDEVGTAFLHDIDGNLASHDEAQAFIAAAQNNLRLRAERIDQFNATVSAKDIAVTIPPPPLGSDGINSIPGLINKMEAAL